MDIHKIEVTQQEDEAFSLIDNTAKQVENLSPKSFGAMDDGLTSDDCPYGQIRQLGDQLHNILCGLQDEPIADDLSSIVSRLWDVRNPKAPQQKAERERQAWAENVITEIMDLTGIDFTDDGDIDVVKAMYDAGYRKEKS
nr:hypothetical protein [uncultured Vibrio sp.]